MDLFESDGDSEPSEEPSQSELLAYLLHGSRQACDHEDETNGCNVTSEADEDVPEFAFQTSGRLPPIPTNEVVCSAKAGLEQSLGFEIHELNHLGGDDIPLPEAEGLREFREIAVDSGAELPVCDPEDMPGVPVEPHSGRKKMFVGAGGDKIEHLGTLRPNIMTENGAVTNTTFQAAKVRTPLLSVSSVEDKGNMTVFDENGSFIIPRHSQLLKKIRELVAATDHKIPLHRRRGIYTMRVWQMPAKKPSSADEGAAEGFSRQGK